MLDSSYQKTEIPSEFQRYEERLSKRREREREEMRVNEFLHNSLRSSDRLRELERTNKVNYKINAGFVNDVAEDGGDETIDIVRLTKAICNRKNVKANLSKPDMDWLNRFVASDDFLYCFNMSLMVPTILNSYNYPAVGGSDSAQTTLQAVISHLSHFHDKAVESRYKYQIRELLQILNNVDVRAICEINDKCMKQKKIADEQRKSRNSFDPDESVKLSSEPSVPQAKPKPVPKTVEIVEREKPPKSSQRILNSPFPGCYAEIHLTENGIPIKTVVLEKGNRPLGATVRNEREAVVIGRIVMGGVAQKSELLKEGDELLSVNGIELTGKDINEVSDILARMSGTLQFTVASATEGFRATMAKQLSSTTIRLRAFFTYNANEDAYIPCKDIGLSFNRGDILHVTNVQDPNWWQAYKEEDCRGNGMLGELAGLIPSPDYQYEREKLRKQLGGETASLDAYASTRNESSMLCLKKQKKGNAATVNGGWIFNTDLSIKQNGTDNRKRKARKGNRGTYCPSEFEMTQIDESIIAYEEVQLYLPQPRRKRPIVLVGSELTGRHELINKICASDPDQFSIVKKHTTNENGPSDCIHVSKNEFLHMLNQEDFIEIGEFEKQKYGTSKMEIRKIIDAGRTALMVLQPESLRVIRNTTYIPYIIFIRPPNSIETLRNLRIKLDSVRPPDEELINSMKRSKEIDFLFGHLFDSTVTIDTLDKAMENCLNLIKRLERDPQWVSSRWLNQRTLSTVQ